jgi:intracellular septation protein A
MTAMTEDLAASTAVERGERRRRLLNTAVEILINVVLPFAIYSLAKARLGDAGALMASSTPPILWSIVEFARRRRVDALSVLVLTGIALSLLAFVGGGGVRFLQLREQSVTGLIGLIFLGSAAVGRPLIYFLIRAMITRTAPAKAARFVALRHETFFRRAMLTMTLAWGVGLVVQCALAVSLTYTLTVPQFMIAGPVVGYGVPTLLTLWTSRFVRRTIVPYMNEAGRPAA